jgi:hypothetical protein
VQISEIKVGELLDFIKSGDYQKLDIKPITELRAISQYHNPDADAEDIALIYAEKNNELLGFAGLLPKKINGEKEKVFANSCWWANQSKGKGIAIPIFYQLLKRADNKLFIAESTPRAKSIIEKTGLFGEIKPHTGLRGFVRFYFADIVRKKYPGKRWFSKPFVLVDFLLNLLFLPYRGYFLAKFKKNSLTLDKVETVDKEQAEFIQKHSSAEFVQKSAANFGWFKKYPWLKKEDAKNLVNYPFTSRAKRFELNYYALKRNSDIKAFIAISNRDNLAKVPFVYFEKDIIKEVVDTILQVVLERKYDSLVMFHPEILDFMEKNKMPFYFRRAEIKYTGTTKKVEHIFRKKQVLQDGDGDAIFI